MIEMYPTDHLYPKAPNHKAMDNKNLDQVVHEGEVAYFISHVIYITWGMYFGKHAKINRRLNK